MEPRSLDPVSIDRLDLDAAARAHLLGLVEIAAPFCGPADCELCAELREALGAHAAAGPRRRPP